MRESYVNAWWQTGALGMKHTCCCNQQTDGTGRASAFWRLALQGWLAFFISISGMRGAIVKGLPNCVMLATSGGIGLFLSFIGLQVRAQQGVVV